MTLVASDAAFEYLASYLRAYRAEYSRFTRPVPEGSGYPALQVSPYLTSDRIDCLLGSDGAIVLDTSWEPSYQWAIAGGPTLLVDYEPTRTPQEVVDLLVSEGIFGKSIGIYRIVSKEHLPLEIWTGVLPKSVSHIEGTVDGKHLVLREFDVDLKTLLDRVTLGASRVLDMQIPDLRAGFWKPLVIRDFGFATADRRNQRFIHYAEISPHREQAAWEQRSIWARVGADVRRDFATSVSRPGTGGTFEYPREGTELDRSWDRLSSLGTAVSDFADFLTLHREDAESYFHEFIAQRPVLLDLYGEVVSKPRFTYPIGQSPTGKAHVEPDFVVCYPNRTYRLIEIERPNKNLSTRQGQPRAEVTQAAYQIAEWKDFIAHFPEVAQLTFPGIAGSYSSMVVIGSSSTPVPPGGDLHRYIALIRQQLQVDEIMVYEDLIHRAQVAYSQIAALASNVPKFDNPPDVEPVRE